MFLAVNGSRKTLITFLFFLFALTMARAQGAGDLDNYRWRVDGELVADPPDRYFGLNGSNNYVNFNQDFKLSKQFHVHRQDRLSVSPASTTFY